MLNPQRVKEIARSLGVQPRGIGSRWADALDFADTLRAVVKIIEERENG
jgi:hypothetical protein